MATVLVVDDDPNARLLVRTVLEHFGHTVTAAGDGETALELVAQHAPDLVLLDLSLPAMSGPEFVRALRSQPGGGSVRVALYTASSPNAAMRDFMEIYGIAGRVPKPSEPAELNAAVEKILRSR